MIGVDRFPIRCFRESPLQPDTVKPGTVIDDEPEEEPSDREVYLLCAQCHEIITRPADRISVQGAHRHIFANPHGIIFEIGCFISVKGCAHAGPATDEFSWFNGFSWKAAYCRMCLTHLGWFFSSTGGNNFYGLVLDRLVESKD